MRPDGHRQDRLLRPPDDRYPVRGPRQVAHAADAHPGADARTGRPGGRELRDLRQVPQAQHGAADRRRELPRPGARARARRRRADRHPGPPARPLRARRHPAERREDPGDRRSRSHARHGLHPRCRAHRRPAVADAPDAVLLGHHAAGDPPPRRPLPQQPQGSDRVAAGLGRHQHRPGPGRRAGGGQARGAARPDQEPGASRTPWCSATASATW